MSDEMRPRLRSEPGGEPVTQCNVASHTLRKAPHIDTRSVL